ncbi:MAG: FAD-dependent oxidoreductase [Geminicoccaceae bacterium]
MMVDRVNADICVLGAGSGGLSVAAGAAQLGARTVLIERAKMGGDCLNHGCVPSKSLIAAAYRAHVVRSSSAFGIEAMEPRVDMASVRRHIHRVIAAIEPHDSAERFEGLGVQVIREHGRFVGEREVVAGNHRIRARRFVIATGSRAAIPPVPGLESVDILTNETVFDLDTLPGHLLILGAGPIGCELAQAFHRLGSAVTMVDIGPMLARDDGDMRRVVRESLIGDGVAIRDSVKVERVEQGPSIVIRDGNGIGRIEGTHLLVAAGRVPNIEDLGLDAAGIEYDRRGVTVDGRLRTTRKTIFAIGDVTGRWQFTHVAGHQAGIVIRNALFRLPARMREDAIPRVTYTDPELAHVGLSEEEAREKGIVCEILHSPFAENDRARAEGAVEGGIKLVATRKGKVLGATIVGAHAGELILPWVMAIEQDMKLSKLASMLVPYPTLSEIGKRVAGSFYTPRLFNARTRMLVRWLARLG